MTILISLALGTGAAFAESDSLSSDSLSIVVFSPKDQENVSYETFVTGKVSDPSAQVWVVLHYMGNQSYNVQKRITVRSNGLWKILLQGISGGDHYELMAFANPKEKLRPGQSLDYWPKAEANTSLIEIIGSR